MMIDFIQPYDFSLNIGKAYNDAVSKCDNWVCITDQDTLKFEGFARRVKTIVDQADKRQVITCTTNRLRRDNKNVIHELYDESDINVHWRYYNDAWDTHGSRLERTKEVIAGACMIFHKSVWDTVKFREQEVTFDGVWTTQIRRAGFTTWCAVGLYIFHLYRWGRDVGDTRHLYPSKYVN